MLFVIVCALAALQFSTTDASCAAGYYPANSTACLACPAGFACVSNQAPVACLAGFYSAGYAQVCSPCASGTYANSTASRTCTSCPSGYACLDSASAPVLCPAGSVATAGSAVCTVCSQGTYSPSAGASVCQACPIGYSCNSPAQSPVACSTGYYSRANASQCTPCSSGTRSSPNNDVCLGCLAGYSCGQPSVGPQACSAGSYSNAPNATDCVVCPAGSYCPSLSSSPLLCPSGYYSAAGATNCTAAPAGSACSDRITVVTCSSGQYSLGGASACLTCTAGWQCSSSTSAPIACSPGSYSLSGSVNCTICPAGSSCSTVSASPVTCAAGTYALAGSLSCTACPAGFSCASTTSSPQACTSGSYALSGSTTCTSCPAGSSCSSTSASPAACASGTYSAAAAIDCTACPAGFACPSTSNSAAITACLAGTYSVGSAIVCTSCPAGFACPSIAAAIQVPCPSGSYSLGNSPNCTTCPAGFSCSTTTAGPTACASGAFSTGGASACTSCPAGSYCPDPTSSNPLPCLSGSYSLTGATACTVCPADKACPSTSSAVMISCTATAGLISLGNQSACTLCPAGYLCSGSNGVIVQTACSAGQYSNPGASVCVACPAGYMCSNPSTPPVACPAGTYSLASSANCTTCPAGSACSSSTSAPVSCPVGKYSIIGSATCLPCNAGFLCLNVSTSASPADQPCPIGSYCPTGSTVAVPCPVGTFNPASGAPDVSYCQSCTAGSYCPAGSTNTSLSCPIGYYCPTGTQFSTQFPCPAGTYLPLSSTPAVSLAQCVACPAGSYCVAGFQSNSSNACPAGYYCPQSTESATQFPCPAGTYTPNNGSTSASACTACPAGAYCPIGSAQPTLCPAGTFGAFNSTIYIQSCSPCTAGWACPSIGLTSPSTQCSIGFFCPSGTAYPSSNPCPPGTYGNSTTLYRPEDCTSCPAAFACPTGSNYITQPPVACAAGFYCPLGTSAATQNPCPSGTYYSYANATAASNCEICPTGSYCKSGSSAPTGVCSAGYYCPVGSAVATQNACPAGFYMSSNNASSLSDCQTCTAGSFCASASAAPVPCTPGTFAALTGMSSCTQTTAGSYSIAGQSVSTVCSPGYFSAAGASVCSPCFAGAFCLSNTSQTLMQSASNQCPAGMFCPAGTSVSPSLPTFACQSGQYCLAGATSRVNCSAGTYQPSTAASACLVCPAGSYCAEGSSVITGQCSPGYFCGNYSTGATMTPCAGGTYRSTSGATSQSDCSVCPAGAFCPGGVADPTLLVLACPQGYYCPAGTSVPLTCPKGTYGNASSLIALSNCTTCDPGYFCDSIGLAAPTGVCSPGFFCLSGAVSSTPTDGVTGNYCARGGYCPAGSWASYACPAGSFNNQTGSRDASSCFPCTPGFYCINSAQPAPTGPCDPGFYCTGGSQTPQQNPCPSGTFCPSGSSLPSLCEAGTYNAAANASACAQTPAGFYTSGQAAIYYTPCPIGSYCLIGTFSPLPCPLGSYGNRTGLTNSSECLPCVAGSYCGLNGQSAPTGPCQAGYYCLPGATLATPTTQSFGGVCPVGSYCPSGSATPTPCPAGTYSSSTLGSSLSNCQQCPPAYHCNASGLTAPMGLCAAGFWCANGSSSPYQYVCPIGSYCPVGTASPIACAAGSYSNASGLSVCMTCPPGYQCGPGASFPVACPAGSYCPSGTGASPISCPPGRFSNQSMLTAASDCALCPGGSFCAGAIVASSLEVTGLCTAGYYCVPGSFNTYGGLMSLNGSVVLSQSSICPAGAYCPPSSATFTLCPIGTFSASLGNSNDSLCLPCTAGSFCGSAGLAAPTGLCTAGSYCDSGSSIATSALCPAGFSCPAGCSAPVACTAGYYQANSGRSACVIVPAGFYADANASSLTHCPLGYYCPLGSTNGYTNACPAGTYGSRVQLVAVTDCTSAPGGYYIATAGQQNATDLCQAGFACFGKATSATPTDGVTGAACTIGTYCPAGSATFLNCSGGYYCDVPQLAAPTGPCADGYYCTRNAVTPTPSNAVCPAGYYCPSGSPSPLPCPIATYSPQLGLSSVNDCLTCPAGSFCNSTGQSTVLGVSCWAGYYCPTGTNVPNLQCAAGYACPLGSTAPVECGPGTYQPQAGQSACLTALPGYYAPLTVNSVLLDCPPGSVCGNGTQLPTDTLCPIGTFSNQSNLQSISRCSSCTPGSYCSTSGLTAPTGQCLAGYYCPSNSSSMQQIICPVGSFCITGSPVPTYCAAGTFASSTGNQNIGGCVPCSAGAYCAITGLSAISGNCSAGYYCSGGAVTPTPSTDSTGGICLAGTYCTIASVAPKACPIGSYSASNALSSCSTCPAGFVCGLSNGTSVPSSCPIGFYCPTGTNNAANFPCVAPTYGAFAQLSSQTQCTACPSGSYCATNGLSAVTGTCSVGYYCSGNSSTSTPAGAMCAPGQMCPAGSAAPIPCPGGSYCGAYALATTSGTCQAGYYCSAGASVSAPRDGVTGNICPAGSFCTAGSNSAQLCPAGSFSPSTGLVSQTSCLSCTAGYYCNTAGLSSISSLTCFAGYYCPNGTITPQSVCPIGAFCPNASSAPVPCAPGTYQNTVGSSACKSCSVGYACPDSGNSQMTPCAAGSYCPVTGIQQVSQYPCPNGTYSNSSGLSSVSQCLACPAGQYCPYLGQTAPTGYCAAGYLCISGSSSPTPSGGSSGSPCPTGKICLVGTISPQLCPPGTLAPPTSGNSLYSSCLPCPAGVYCGLYGAASSTTLCSGGYVCTGGANTSVPVSGSGYACAPGTYCLAGSLAPSLCQAGTYNSDYSRSACTSCPAGSLCFTFGLTNFSACPMGSYCPTGSAAPIACPAGTFSTQYNLGSSSQCSACLRGQYCESAGLTVPTGPCIQGFFCNSGSASPAPPDQVCPAGFYCGFGTISPSPCAAGTYNPTGGATNSSSCLPCKAGSYCGSQGLSAPSGPCTGGYYCPSGSISSFAIVCPQGFYCSTGAATPMGCLDGTYQFALGASACNDCQPGYYCTGNATQMTVCPPAYYCPARSAAPSTCPAGSIGPNHSGLTSALDCVPCSPGKYCAGDGSALDCSAGYTCYSGSPVPNPSSGLLNWLGIAQNWQACAGSNSTSFSFGNGTCTNTVGGLCPAGFYCGLGNSVPLACPNGTYQPSPGASLVSQCMACAAGGLCQLAGTANPTPCPPGSYCFGNTAYQCPAGTYNRLASQSNITSCLPCVAGYTCSYAGLGDYSASPCPTFSYCPSGSISPIACPPGTLRTTTGATSLSDCTPVAAGYYSPTGNYSVPCPAGSACPSGNAWPGLCPGGFYCPPQTSSPIPCSTGFYCPLNSSVPIECQPGTYCPAYSVAPSPCPAGTFTSGAVNRTSLDISCTSCAAGYYSNATGSQTCSVCDAGYLCTGGASTSAPTVSGGSICPAGYYCPAGATSAIPCPVGTVGAQAGLGSLSQCTPCAANTYNGFVGQTKCAPCGSSSTSSTGAVQCSCRGLYRSFQSSNGACLCQTGYVFYSEGVSLSQSDGSTDCQPVVYSRCATGQARDSYGNCLDLTSQTTCSTQCQGRSGTFSVTLGICDCAGTVDLNSVCNANCRSTAPSVTYSDGSIVTTDPNTGITTSLNLANSSAFAGKLADCSGSCKLLPMVISNGIGGTYSTPSTLVANSKVQSVDRSIALQHLSKLRARAGSSNMKLNSLSDSDIHSEIHSHITLFSGSSTSATITPAIVCLQLGQGLLFDVSTSYPVYDKDNLLNTNSNFDYGAFLDLKLLLQNNATNTVKVFGFTFTTAGVYVFYDAKAPSQFSVLKVAAANENCPLTASIVPFTSSALVSMGVNLNSNIVSSPDWTLIGVLLGMLGALFVLVVGGTYHFQKRSWGHGDVKPAKFRLEALQSNLDVWTFSSKGTSTKSLSDGIQDASALQLEHKSADQSWSFLSCVPTDSSLPYEMMGATDFEGFDFHALQREIESMTSESDSHFARQSSDWNASYRRLLSESEQIKALLFTHVELDAKKSSNTVFGRLLQAEIQVRRAQHMEFVELRDRCAMLVFDVEAAVGSMRECDTFAVLRVLQVAQDECVKLQRIHSQSALRRQSVHALTSIVAAHDPQPISWLLAADQLSEQMESESVRLWRSFASATELPAKRIKDGEASLIGRIEEVQFLGSEGQNEQMQLLATHQTMVLNAVKEIATLASGAKNISTQLESALSSALQERNSLWDRVDSFCQSLKDAQKALKHDQDDDDMYSGLSPELAQALRLLIEAELKPVQKVTEPKVENVVVTQLDEVLKDSQSKLTNQNDDAQTANLRAQLLQRARDAQINAVTIDVADSGSDAVGDAIVLPVLDLSSTVHRVQDQLEAQLDSQLNMSNEDLLLGLLQQAFAQDVETGQRLAALLRDRQFIALSALEKCDALRAILRSQRAAALAQASTTSLLAVTGASQPSVLHIVSDQDMEDPALLIQRLYEQSNNSETGVNIDEVRVLAALHQVEAVRLVEHEIMLAAQGVDSANRQKALRDKLRADHKRTRDAIREQQQQLEQQQQVQTDKPGNTLSEAQAVIDVLQTQQKQTQTDIQSRHAKELESWQQSIAQHQELYQALIKLRINVSCRESEVQFKAQKNSTGESDFDELQLLSGTLRSVMLSQSDRQFSRLKQQQQWRSHQLQQRHQAELSIADFAQKNKQETLLNAQSCALESRWAFACDTLFGALVADVDAKFMDQFTKLSESLITLLSAADSHAQRQNATTSFSQQLSALVSAHDTELDNLISSQKQQLQIARGQIENGSTAHNTVIENMERALLSDSIAAEKRLADECVIWKSLQARLEQRLLVLQAHAADVAGGVGESKQVLQRLLNTLQEERAVADQAADSEKARQLGAIERRLQARAAQQRAQLTVEQLQRRQDQNTNGVSLALVTELVTLCAAFKAMPEKPNVDTMLRLSKYVLRIKQAKADAELARKHFEQRAECIAKELDAISIDGATDAVAAIESKVDQFLDASQADECAKLKLSQRREAFDLARQAAFEVQIEWPADRTFDSLEANQSEQSTLEAFKKRRQVRSTVDTASELDDESRRRRAEVEKAARSRLEAEMRDLEQKQNEEVDRRLSAADALMKSQVEAKMKQAEELRARELDALRDVDEDTKLRLMQQHRRELEALEEATLAEQFRQKQRLRGRLEARARKASQAERVVLESQVRERVLMSEIEALERRRDALQRQTATLGPQTNVSTVSGSVDQASAAAAMAAVSELQNKIDAMQTALEAAVAKLKHKQQSNQEQAQAAAVVFVDQLEQTLASADAPGAFDPERSRVSVDTLSPQQRLLWSRCQQVTRGILSQFDAPPIELVLVNALPQADQSAKCPFVHSFRWLPTARRLLIRVERLHESEGAILSLCTHACTHIMDAESADQAPTAVARVWHQALSGLHQSYSSPPSAGVDTVLSAHQQSSKSTNSALRRLMGTQHSLDVRAEKQVGSTVTSQSLDLDPDAQMAAWLHAMTM